MYAVIETGGKQYRVELGTEVAIERLEAAPGETINFERVLLIADGEAAQIGTPVVSDALVTGEVLRQDRGDKVIVFKYRPKARHRTKKGHRQEQTVIRVADIRFNGRSAADEAGVQEKEEAKVRKAAAAEAQRKATADKALADKLAHEEEAREAKAKADEKAKTPDKKPTAAKAKPARHPLPQRRRLGLRRHQDDIDQARGNKPSSASETTPKAKATPAAKAAPAAKATPRKPAAKTQASEPAKKPAAKSPATRRSTTKKES